jgi:hypothetical protein
MDPIVKLLLFSVIMLVAPVSAYFAASRGDLDGTVGTGMQGWEGEVEPKGYC